MIIFVSGLLMSMALFKLGSYSTTVYLYTMGSKILMLLLLASHDYAYPFANHATGKPYVSIKKRFQRLMEEADLEGVTAHVLRHTAASIMINSGRSLYEVQRLLRHSSSIVTEKYSHLSTESVMAASDTISEQLFKAASGM